MSHDLFAYIELFSIPPAQWLWFWANFWIGVSYFAIPFEMWVWARGRPLGGARPVILAFVMFIIACGIHHLWMLQWFPHHPVNRSQVAIDTITALISVLVAFVLFQIRGQIRELVRFVQDCVEFRGEVIDLIASLRGKANGKDRNP